MIGFEFDQVATIYNENAGTGRYTDVVKSGLACRLIDLPQVSRFQRQTERSELAAMKIMMFDPDYVLSEQSQIEIDGVRWQPFPGSFSAYRDWNSDLVYRRCDVFRQQTTSF